ncbi:MAG: hypothetical protein GQ527_03420 [Bacteroidales bacterium]|nr:hypothetical protein [Bacteroidales bacterium]
MLNKNNFQVIVNNHSKYMIKVFYSIIIIFSFLFSPLLKAENKFKLIPIANKKIAINQPLSQGRVTDIIEDERGFMWFATIDGLNRYDGYEVKIFRRIKGDSTSISSNQISKIVEDKDGYIWIATTNGLNKFDPYQEIFHHYSCPTYSQGYPVINDLVIDRDNNIWFGTQNGLFFIANKKDEIKHISLDITFSPIHSLLIDSENQLWIGHNGKSIKRYNLTTKLFKDYTFPFMGDQEYSGLKTHEDSNKNIWFSMFVNSFEISDLNTYYYHLGDKEIQVFNHFNNIIIENEILGCIGNVGDFASRDHELWAASNTSSLAKFDFSKNELTYYPEYRDFKWHKEIGKTSVYIDSRGLLWYGTTGDGVYILPEGKNEFNLVNIDLFEQLTVQSIRSFCEDDEDYWFSGYFGAAKMNKKNGRIINVNSSQPIYTIDNYPNNDNYLLVGLEGGGICRLNKKTGVTESLADKYNSSITKDLKWQWVYSTLIENDTICWLGCMDGILKMDFKNGTSETFDFKEVDAAYNGHILSLYRDFSGILWAGSSKTGLVYYSDSLSRFALFEPQIPTSLNIENLRINCITQTPDSTLWLGTSEGLLKINKEEIQLFTEAEQLPNDFVYGILIDETGTLWLSTNNGICSFNPENKQVKSYTSIEGLQDKEFNTGAYFKSNDGRMFFGGVKGFNHFYPSEMFQSQAEAPIILTGIKMYNEYIELTKDLVEKGEIIIPSEIEYFNIEFAGLNYLNALGNIYKYKIEEIHEDWITLGNKHEINFHSLDPGTYHLQILAANNQGKWNEKVFKLKIVVLASFRQTIYFRILFISIFLSILFYIVYWRFRKIKLQKTMVEEIVEQRTEELFSANAELLKANQTKDQFFSIISHDLKNPIGAAQAVSEELKDNFQTYNAQEQQDLLNIMDSAIKNIRKLLTNLLTWSQVQQDMIIAKPENLVLEKSVRSVLVTYSQNIQEKSLGVEISIEKDIQVFADIDLLSVIIRNLLSNAIKFTPDEGKITISAEVIDDHVLLQFIDNGVGMSDKTIKKLFTPGNNISTPGTKRELGTGMGLLLINDFVKLNKGKIWVVSKKGSGSTFFVSLPRKKSDH